MTDVVNKYEAGVSDRSMRERFMEEFNPAKIGILNDEEMMKDQLAIPQFSEQAGDTFLGVTRDGKVLVFPNPVLSVNHISNDSLKKAFFVDDHNMRVGQGQSYHVRRPAVFKRNGTSLEIIERGQLSIY